MKRGICPNKNKHRQGEGEEYDVDEEIELSLGLSMNGRFGVDPMRNKKLKRSSPIAYLAPKARGCVEIGADRRALGLVSACHAPALARMQSLPVETEEEWRRQKELQSVRQMEVRKKRMRTGSSGSSDLIDGLICDRGLTLGHLLGGLHDFFSRLGMSKLKFKPAYNPYTEPSMEFFM